MRTILLSLVLLCIGCQTKRALVPKLNLQERVGLSLETPINVSIIDSRNNIENSEESIQSIKRGLKQAYGDNVRFINHFEKSNSKAVTIKIDIKQLESDFGVRSIQYTTIERRISAVSVRISDYWGTSVASAISEQSYLKSNFRASGYWIGTTYLDIRILDGLSNEKFDFPIAAEDAQNNTMGYSSARKASQNSWDKASRQLVSIIDSIALKIVENE